MGEWNDHDKWSELVKEFETSWKVTWKVNKIVRKNWNWPYKKYLLFPQEFLDDLNKCNQPNTICHIVKSTTLLIFLILESKVCNMKCIEWVQPIYYQSSTIWVESFARSKMNEFLSMLFDMEDIQLFIYNTWKNLLVYLEGTLYPWISWRKKSMPTPQEWASS